MKAPFEDIIKHKSLRYSFIDDALKPVIVSTRPSLVKPFTCQV